MRSFPIDTTMSKLKISFLILGEAKRQEEAGPSPAGHQRASHPAPGRGHQGDPADLATDTRQDLPRREVAVFHTQLW